MSTDAKPYAPADLQRETSAVCSECYDVPCECQTKNHLLVERLRAELAASESLVTALQEQMARMAEQCEEVREACARAVEAEAINSWRVDAERVRATPLDATPLAARIAELEALLKTEKEWTAAFKKDAEATAEYELKWNTERRRAEAAESALAAEAERHQATEQDAADLRMMLSAWESGDLRPGYIAATEEAIEGGTNRSALAEYAASLPARGGR